MHAYADRRPSARDRAFERLYRRYVTDVYRYTLALLRNPADAEDVTQTTFLNAYRAYQRGEEPLKPQNWLITIAHNACRTRYVRASRRPQEVPLEKSLRELAVPAGEIPNVSEVLDALARLPFNQRAALVMRELEGRSYAEISQALGVTVPAVETLIFRARRSLRMRRSAFGTLAALPLPSSLSSFSGGATALGGGAMFGSGVLLKAVLAVGVGVVAGTAGSGLQAQASRAAATVEARHDATPTVTPGGIGGARRAQAVRAATTFAYRSGRARSGAWRVLERTHAEPRQLPRRDGVTKAVGSAHGSPGAVSAPAQASGSASAQSGSPAASPVTALKDTIEKTVPTPAVPVAAPTPAVAVPPTPAAPAAAAPPALALPPQPPPAPPALP